ncbi:MAG: ATP-binding cassette domain-containing protein [Pseudohongiellaceae bacterium]
MTSKDCLLRVDHASCRINRQSQLRVTHFSVRQGEHWCLFGGNGSGKTLLANLIAGKRLESGSYVTYREGLEPGRDIMLVSFEEQQRLWQRDNRLDMSEYSDRAEDPGTTVSQLLRSGLAAGDGLSEAYDSIVEQLDLDKLLLKGIRFLSSGQIRRALIGRALIAAVGDPRKLLVFDDPLESIDESSRQRIIDCIEACRKSGFSSLLLCRRHRDILPGTTHLALLENLELTTQGLLAEVLATQYFRERMARTPELPDSLPLAEPPEMPASAFSKVIIDLEDIHANYGDKRVLESVTWRMTSSHHTLIEGPNGCGKSTLLSLICGENHMAYGQKVRLFGTQRGSGETVWEIKSRFGLVSNELHNKYVKGWKALDVVVSGLYDSVGLYDDSVASDRAVAKAWLSCFGLADSAACYYHELSFGQQRLVLLARAMVKNPAILILDEPCVGLDDYHRQLILGVLDLIASQTRTRLIYVSHVSEEWPVCINQRLEFVPAGEHTHSVVQHDL